MNAWRMFAKSLARGETVFLAGLGLPGTHNSGVALVEVTQAHGPRLILNNEEERFSGNKHTTEYPRQSIDAMVAALRGMGRDIGDIDAWLTSWDYPRWPARLCAQRAGGGCRTVSRCCASPTHRRSTAAGSTR